MALCKFDKCNAWVTSGYWYCPKHRNGRNEFGNKTARFVKRCVMCDRIMRVFTRNQKYCDTCRGIVTREYDKKRYLIETQEHKRRLFLYKCVVCGKDCTSKSCNSKYCRQCGLERRRQLLIEVKRTEKSERLRRVDEPPVTKPQPTIKWKAGYDQ